LDCIYFAVITLTTAGLGDFVPTSDFNKIICSIFIYFGVACIGLLLGSYIAGMLDETSRRQAHQNRINSCPNCTRLQNIKDAAERRYMAGPTNSFGALPPQFHSTEHIGMHHEHENHKPARFVGSPATSSKRFDHDFSPFSTGHKKIKRKHHDSSSNNAADNRQDSSVNLVPPTQSDVRRTPATIPELEVSATPSLPKRMVGSCTGDDHGQNRSDSRAEPSSITKSTSFAPPVTTATLNAVKSFGSMNAVSPSSPGFPPVHEGSSESPKTPFQTPKIQAVKQEQTNNLLGSPMTKQILGRQSHTRHASFDVGGRDMIQGMSMNTHKTPTVSQGTPTISEDTPFLLETHNFQPNAPRPPNSFDQGDGSYSDHDSSTDASIEASTSDSFDSKESDEFEVTKGRVRTAKYVFLTLKEALVNSMVIIAFGCLGFWFVEGFTLVDSKFIFTTGGIGLWHSL